MTNAVYNPHNKNVEDLPTIFGFNNGGHPGFMHGCLLAEDGEFLGSHLCSSEGYMYGDLGIDEGSRPDRHETFREHYPDGYKMEFVGADYIDSHEKLLEVIIKANEKSQEVGE